MAKHGTFVIIDYRALQFLNSNRQWIYGRGWDSFMHHLEMVRVLSASYKISITLRPQKMQDRVWRQKVQHLLGGTTQFATCFRPAIPKRLKREFQLSEYAFNHGCEMRWLHEQLIT